MPDTDRRVPRNDHCQECNGRGESPTSIRRPGWHQPLEKQDCDERQQRGRSLGQEREPKGRPHDQPPTESSLGRTKKTFNVGRDCERLERSQDEIGRNQLRGQRRHQHRGKRKRGNWLGSGRQAPSQPPGQHYAQQIRESDRQSVPPRDCDQTVEHWRQSPSTSAAAWSSGPRRRCAADRPNRHCPACSAPRWCSVPRPDPRCRDFPTGRTRRSMLRMRR